MAGFTCQNIAGIACTIREDIGHMPKYHGKRWVPGNAANLLLIIHNWMSRESQHLNPFGQFNIITLEKDYSASTDSSNVLKPKALPGIHWELDNGNLSGEFRRALKRVFGDVGGLHAKGNPPFVRIEGRKNFYVLCMKQGGGGDWFTAPNHFWWTARSVHPDTAEIGIEPRWDHYATAVAEKDTRLHSEGIYPSAYRANMHFPGGSLERNPGVFPLGRGLNGPRVSDVWDPDSGYIPEWVPVCSLQVSVRNSFECEYTCTPKKDSGNLSELVRTEDKPLLDGFTEEQFETHRRP